MFGDERDGDDDDRQTFRSGPLDFRRRFRPGPPQRSHAALVAHDPGLRFDIRLPGHRRRRSLDLPLVWIAAGDDPPRQSVRREQDTRFPPAARRDATRHRLHEGFRLGRDEGLVGRVAAHGRRGGVDSRDPCGPPPRAQRRRRRRRRKLRIKRQQEHPIGRIAGHIARRLLAEGMPVAHRDEDTIRPASVQDFLQRVCLRPGFLENRRRAAQFGVDPNRLGRPAPRDPPREREPQRTRHPQDRGVSEKVDQKGTHGRGAVRPAQIEQNHRRLQDVRTAATRAETFSGGVAFNTPCPRLKTNGPLPRTDRISRTWATIASPPTSSETGSRFPCTAQTL